MACECILSHARELFSKCPTTFSALATIGALVVALWTIKRVFGLLAYLFMGRNVRKFGAWAVVTGATDGIGFAYCKQLARKGLNIVLVSRSQERLEEKAKELAKFNVQTRVVVADFSNNTDQLYQSIADALKDVEVGVLVNNVGVSYEHAQYLTELDEARARDLINVNVVAMTRMTRIVLPGMEKRRRGLIINVASAAGVMPVGDPLYTVYSASKAYVDFFSRSLHYEMRGRGILTECHVPYFVVSKMSKLRHASLFVPTPDTYAAASLRAVGRCGPTVVPYWPHALQHCAVTMLPTFAVAMLVLRHHHGIRARALRKKQSQKTD